MASLRPLEERVVLKVLDADEVAVTIPVAADTIAGAVSGLQERFDVILIDGGETLAG